MRTLPPGVLARGDSYDAGVSLADRLKAFKDLPDHPLFMSIHGRLVQGDNVMAVTRWLQDTVGPDDPFHPNQISFGALRRKLQRYRQLLPPAMVLEPSYLEMLTKRVDVQIDVVRELGGLIYYQKQRVSQFAGREKEFPMGMTVEQQRKEVEELKNLLLAMRDTQVMLGITPGTLIPQLQMNQTTVNVLGDGEDVDPLNLLLSRSPELIPRVMEALDRAFVAETIIDGEAQDVTSFSEGGSTSGPDASGSGS
jgi:hypothetical protein